ncbi:uncharacterized protein MONOS_7128 [Monocercomonoides exilis]|uniref:uncharacterized protein n=1 Tax=Monocercomonoides exilis TaxID=2049356 RepID=UPI00355A4748|nr:hypothetical protein MONOS_7128 [Monocercomonoides exilis]|eukprot:MONOS_7128.1-p1 / transcript=MONOS_7128.1 / gene=MONOS_7128 / organism=Monocercomonoides_exilis_PA203 / gene_product=unspecified product / transcript_product=unspecified product / location=Mono_scaffold00237:29767-30987(+) / protein_length=349 / sequence_SO=supercontig / SO=protein_coding / is_pseudo=false
MIITYYLISLDDGNISRLICLRDPNVVVVFVSPVELQADVVECLKKLLVARAVQQSSLRSAPSSSSSSSLGAARRTASPFWRRRSEKKNAAGDDKPLLYSSAPVIDSLNTSEEVASYMSEAAMDDVQSLLGLRRAVLYGCITCAYDVALSAMLSVLLMTPLPSLAASSRRVVVKLNEEAMGRGVAVCEVGEIVEKGLNAVGLRKEDVVLSPAAIVLEVLEEREEAEGGDGNEEKGGYPTAHREFVERIKENQGKLEEAMAPLIVEALGLSGLRFVKAEAEVGAYKQHSVEPEVRSSSPSDGIQQENRIAEEEEADGSLGISSDGSANGVGKDEEQVEISTNGLAMNEE